MPMDVVGQHHLVVLVHAQGTLDLVAAIEGESVLNSSKKARQWKTHML